MRVTSVGVSPTVNQSIALTPELVAAVGARYSRNNEGLEAILEKVKGMDQDKAVDSIFKMIDYGHRSISDMAPVVMFIDDISLFTILRIWLWCPTAGGQESSTRYIKLQPEHVYKSQANENWNTCISNAFRAYNVAYDIWDSVAIVNPTLIGIPQELADSKDERDIKKVERMRRNYAFDRARYFLPLCCKNNVMLSMSANGWVQLAKMLASDVYPESVVLSSMIQVELHKVTPRLTKHAVSDTTYVRGLKREFDRLRDNALDVDVSHVIKLQPAKAHFTAITPDNTAEKDIADDLDYHDNRYSYFGPTIRSTTVRFGWESLTIAELRDLNRHRTGTKTFDLLPTGAYFADDQIDLIEPEFPDEAHRLRLLRHAGQDMIQFAMHQLKQSDPSFVYCLPIGTQCKYEHVTTADKFLYQSELRTGLGAHYSYAARMREVLEMWHKQFPSTRELIRPGTAEPE